MAILMGSSFVYNPPHCYSLDGLRPVDPYRGGIRRRGMKKFLTTVILSAGLLAMPTIAHHGTNAEYDAEHPIVFKANVTEVEFINPHIQIYFDAKDDKGKVVHWAVEGPSPGRLIRMGWSRSE